MIAIGEGFVQLAFFSPAKNTLLPILETSYKLSHW